MKVLLFAIGIFVILLGIIFIAVSLTSEKNLGGFQFGLILGIGITVIIEGILIFSFGKVLEYLEDINYSIRILGKNIIQPSLSDTFHEFAKDSLKNKNVYCSKCNKIIYDSNDGKCKICGTSLTNFE